MLAKFRGVEFNAKKIRYGRGTKTAEADFLGDEEKDQKTELDRIDFAIDGYIYGEKVEITKKKLEQALAKKAGILTLPDGRQESVKIEDGGWHIELSEEADDLYVLDLNFKKADNDNLSLQIIELKEIDDEKLAKIKEESSKSFLADFNDKFTFEGFPNLVKMQSFDNLVSLSEKISALTANNLIGQIANPITGSLDILALSAGGIASALLSYTRLRDLFGDDKDYFDTYLDLAGLSSGTKAPEVSVPATDQIYKNTIASEQLINQSAFAEAVTEAVYHKEYVNEAELKQTINDLLDTSLNIAYDTDNIDIQNQINQLLNMGIALLKSRHAAKTTYISFNQSLPACVIAHRLYGTTNLEENSEKLQKRNHAPHALFMPAGQELEVEVV